MTNYVQRFSRITLPDGTKKRIAARGKTEREALRKLAELEAQYAAGQIIVNGQTTFGEWYKQWLNTYKLPTITYGTACNVRGAFDRYFLPYFANWKLADIKPINIQECINQFQGKSAAYTKKNVCYLKELFKKAVTNGIINSNPCEHVELPKGEPAKERRPLTEDEQRMAIQIISSDHHYLIYGASLACGLRPAEARALRWSDFNAAHGKLYVRHAVANKESRIKEPKTASGVREIPIPDWYLSLLKKLPIPINQNQFLFGDGDAPMAERRYRRGWHSLLRQMDILSGATLYRNKVIETTVDHSLSPYHLRHTYATKLAENNIPLKVAQYLLGHSKPEMTLKIYQHYTTKMLEDSENLLRSII